MDYMNDAGLADLGNAVVARASQDLRKALVYNDQGAIETLKRFFTSRRFNAFTTLDGKILLECLLNEDPATRKECIRAYHRAN